MFFIIIIIVSISTMVSAKYIIEKKMTIANLDIDGTKPEIEIINISNSNEINSVYANKNHEITIRLKLIENNLKQININENFVEIKVGKSIQIVDLKTSLIEENKVYKIYDIIIKNINGDGVLDVILKKGIMKNNSDMENEEKIIETGIYIDNKAPAGELIEEKADGGKVIALIHLSENIEGLEGWNFSEDKLNISKEFTNNISYTLPIVDFAGNKGSVEVNITKATYINVIYASHNSNVGWTYGYGNYDIAGKDAVIKNPILKTEALAFNVSGNIEKDFVQINSYIYTHWGVGSSAKCVQSGLIYNYGYNPSDTKYKSMASNDLVTIKGKKYFQFGGAGINSDTITDINGNNPISLSTAQQFNYGISGIKIKLKDYSQFSVIYQILVNNHGWQEAKCNGDETTYRHNRPFSAFRMALVPKSETQYILDMWNKDIGTINLK